MTSPGFLKCNGFTFTNAESNWGTYMRVWLGTFKSTVGGKIKIECFHGSNGIGYERPHGDSSVIFAQCGGNPGSVFLVGTKGTINGYYYRIGKNSLSMNVVFYPATSNLTGDPANKVLMWNVYLHYNTSSPDFNYFVTVSNKSSWINKCVAMTNPYELNGAVVDYVSISSVHLYYGYATPDTNTSYPISNYTNNDIFYCPEIYNVSYNGLMTTLAGFNVSSSLIYKKNIQSLPDNYNLEMLMKYKPITYELISSDDDKQYPGFIAEDIQDISANLFINFNNGKPDSLDYSRINVHLVKCLQDLNIIVQQNKKEIDELKSIICNL